MIYLIRLAMFCENKEDMTKDTAELVLKIGYTNDDRKTSRFLDYTSSGHRIRIIKTIPGGSIDLEHRIQKYFSQYKFPGRSQEWFCNEPEIIDAFNSCETAEELSKFAVKEISPSRILEGKKKVLVKMWSNVDIDRCVGRLLSNGQDEDDVLRIKDELSHLINDLSLFTDRLRYFCESIPTDDREVVLEMLPEEFVNIYRTVGLKCITKLGYQKGKLIEEYQRLIKNKSLEELVRDAVLSRFVVGNKYTVGIIKSELKSIFDAFGYEKSPKATIIKDYFEVKEVRIKYIRSFEILSIKQ